MKIRSKRAGISALALGGGALMMFGGSATADPGPLAPTPEPDRGLGEYCVAEALPADQLETGADPETLCFSSQAAVDNHLRLVSEGSDDLSPAEKRFPFNTNGEHCLVSLKDRAPVIEPVEPVCFDTYDQVLDEVSQADLKAPAATNVLAVHFNYTSNPGTITISGGQCDGGGLNLSSAWKNRIQATLHKTCGTVKYWDGDNYSGDNESTQGPWDATRWLGGLAERTNSIRYY